MFEVLVASGAHPDVRPRWVTTSLVTHALLITLFVMATKAAIEAPPVDLSETAMLLYVPKPPPPEPPEAKPEPQPAPVVVAEPPPKGFQTVAAPTDIPTVIPEIDLSQRPLDPRDFTGRGVEGGVSYGVEGGTGKVDMAGPPGLDAIYEATTRDERFEQATIVSQPVPVYPAALAAVGIEGRVTVEFVIDTLGAVRAFDAQTGAQIWASQTPNDRGNEASLYGGGIAYDNGFIYATNGLGYVAALDVRTGGIAWQKRPGGPLRGAPTVANGAIYVMSQDNQIYSLKQVDGTTRDTEAAGGDLAAVRLLFDLLFDVVEEASGGLQIIVLEHANLDDPRYQKALVEEPWDGTQRALVPPAWTR